MGAEEPKAAMVPALSAGAETLLRQRVSEEAIGFGTIVRYLPAGPSHWSDGVFRILGVERGDIEPSPETWATFLCGGDREASLAEYEAALRERRPGGGVRRIRRRDGEYRWIETMVRTIPSGVPGVDAAAVVLRDVTQEHEARTALAASERFLDAAQKIAHIGSWFYDIATDRITWSRELYRVFGVGEDHQELTLSWFLRELVHPDDRELVLEAFRRVEVNEEETIDYRIIGGDGRPRTIHSRASVIRGENGARVALLGVSQDVTEITAAQSMLRDYQERLRQLADAVTTSAERERRRLGSDLHDGTVQGLGVLRMKLAELRAQPSARRTSVLYEETFQILDETIRETRSLLQELSPQILYELGFEPAVEWLAEQLRMRHGIECRVEVLHSTEYLDTDAGLVLYQAVRELLANVAKHAKASAAVVTISADAWALRVTVADRGVGFEPGAEAALGFGGGGFGLFSIRERLRLLGGDVAVESVRGVGSKVTASLPWATRRASARGAKAAGRRL